MAAIKISALVAVFLLTSGIAPIHEARRPYAGDMGRVCPEEVRYGQFERPITIQDI